MKPRPTSDRTRQNGIILFSTDIPVTSEIEAVKTLARIGSV
tara:strand:- start:126 stop:248 length:123 start_codon:yes stop_codon:yes gene_type:complete